MARRKKKPKLSELPGQPDPAAPLDGATFLAASQPVLEVLEDDLAARAKSSPAVLAALKKRHADERARERTAEAFDGWLDALVTQVAAAWLLSCVFVRTLEDRALIEQARIAGPGAADSQKQFFALAPSLTEREYLLTIFRELSRLPGVRDIFDARHNPVWKLAPSAEATKQLLELFRLPDADAPAFRFGQPDTRVLGDLYQDLSEAVRKRYALLQTPRFVESFILDRTLERAIERFGLDETDLIDPTCGSGHFLLGAFERLFDHRLRSQPGLDPRDAARMALDAVYGADINPYAVAIARFRLTLAFIDRAGYSKLADVPELPLHLVVADSLLHNPHAQNQTDFKDLEGQSAADWAGEEFALEDEEAAREVLHRKYAAVVGNPPYITVKDKALRDRYRSLYSTCHRNYSLAAPFAERFFQLGKERAFVGQITANSFMKREFGKKLIEEFLPNVNVDLIVNTSGAYIPGHGTPTVLLFGTAEEPRSNVVHAVLAKRGEPSTPNEPENGHVWSSIANHWNETNFENDYISVSKTAREQLEAHPWSLAGGGATELKQLLEDRATRRLGDLVEAIGRSTVAGEDDVWIKSSEDWARVGLGDYAIPLVIGETVRDWAVQNPPAILYPYTELAGEPVPADHELVQHLWPWQTLLENRTVFGKQIKASGRCWWEHLEHYTDKLKTPLSITFAFVATHNHFVLDRGGKVFNRSAPIIKLPETATEDDHLALLAYLNSSTACFWMKQVFFDKGNRGQGGGTTAEAWEKFYEFDGTKLRELPLPSLDKAQGRTATDFAKELLSLGAAASEASNLQKLFDAAESPEALDDNIDARVESFDSCVEKLRRVQEQLDWFIYSLFELSNHALPNTGTRVSDHLFAKRVTAGDVGERYFSLCRLGKPEEVASMPVDSATVEEVLSSKWLKLLEQPVFKRTFREGYRPIEATDQALEWLLGKLEAEMSDVSSIASVSSITKRLETKSAAKVVLDWLDQPRAQLANKLLGDNAVPYLPVFRFTESGLTKYQSWLECWDAQRRDLEAPVPPKYTSKDFSSGSFYRLRGKLDVPKERFISYPGCESDEDGEPVYGWAGWDHLQRAQALAMLYQNRKTEEGWPKERLIPMLAGLYELLPWLKQWHNDQPDPTYGVLMGDYYEQFIEGERNALGLTKDEITGWRPPKKTKGRRKSTKTKSSKTKAKADT